MITNRHHEHPSGGLAVHTAGLSHQGRVRPNQEDAWTIEELTNGLKPAVLFAVADGIGGYQAGEVASRLAVDTIAEVCAATEESARIRLTAAFSRANQRVVEQGEAQAECRGMGSTGVAGLISEDVLTIAWAGDSRAYLVRDGGLVALTHDHRGVGIDGGKLRGGYLVRWLGMEENFAPDCRQVRLHVGDRLLLCTDGLAQVRESEITESATAPIKEWSQLLVQKALDRGGHDNVTVVAAEVQAIPSVPIAEVPAVEKEVDGIRLFRLVREDGEASWFEAVSDSGAGLFYTSCDPSNLEALLGFQEQVEAFCRLQDPAIARVRGSSLGPDRPYVLVTTPADAGPVECLEKRLESPGKMTPNSALAIVKSLALAMERVRLSEMLAGAFLPADFWGSSNSFVLCRWPSRHRRFSRWMDNGYRSDPELEPYRPPDQRATAPAGPASDAYFIGCVLRQLTEISSDLAISRLVDGLTARDAASRLRALKTL